MEDWFVGILICRAFLYIFDTLIFYTFAWRKYLFEIMNKENLLPASISVLKVNSRNTRTVRETFSNQRRRLGVVLTLKRFHSLFLCLHCWLWTNAGWINFNNPLLILFLKLIIKIPGWRQLKLLWCFYCKLWTHPIQHLTNFSIKCFYL